MKILIGGWLAESNAYGNKPCQIRFTITTGEAIADKLYLRALADAEGVELIPALHASCMAAGVITSQTFAYFLNQFVHAVKRHEHEIDGNIFFMGQVTSRIWKGAPAIIKFCGKSGRSSARTCRSRSSAIRMATSIRSTPAG